MMNWIEEEPDWEELNFELLLKLFTKLYEFRGVRFRISIKIVYEIIWN